VKEKYLVIGRDYVAREHPDAEYKYQGVFVEITDHQATEKRPSQFIHVYKHFSFYLLDMSTLTFVSLDVFSKITNDQA